MLATAIAETLRPLHVPGTGRILGPFVPRQGTVTTQYCGYTVDLDLSDLIQWQMALGCYERAETRLMRKLLHPGTTVLDVGANVGHYTLNAAECVGPSGRVVSVEPYHYAADRLSHTIHRNSLQHVTLKRVALSDHEGSTQLADGLPDNHTPSLLTVAPERHHTTIPLARLDDVLDEWIGRFRVVDFMKVDIEGSEPALVRGAQQVLSFGRVRYILMEFSADHLRNAGSSVAKLSIDLKRLGFDHVGGTSTMHLYRHHGVRF